MKSLESLIQRISPSSAALFIQCQYLFYLEKVEGRRRPPGVYTAFGRAFDMTANKAYLAAMGPEELPGDEAVREIFAAFWEAEAAEVEDWWEEDRKGLLDEGTGLARTWRRKIAAPIQPLAVQESFVCSFPGTDWEISGQVDLAFQRSGEPHVILADTKTSRSRWTLKRALDSLQAPAYSLGAIQIFDAPIDFFEFHLAVRSDRDTQVIQRYIDDDQRQAYVRRLAFLRAQMAHCYRSGAWLPTGRDSEHRFCTRRWCAQWHQCEKEWGGDISP